MENKMIDGVKVAVNYAQASDAPVSDDEIKAYIKRAYDKYPHGQLESLTLDVDGATDEVIDPAYHAAPTISVGAACCLTPPMPFEVLYAAADSTLYQVKEAGKAQYQLTVIG